MIWVHPAPASAWGPDGQDWTPLDPPHLGYLYWLFGVYRSDTSLSQYIAWHHWSAFCMSWVTVAWAMLIGTE